MKTSLPQVTFWFENPRYDEMFSAANREIIMSTFVPPIKPPKRVLSLSATVRAVRIVGVGSKWGRLKLSKCKETI